MNTRLTRKLKPSQIALGALLLATSVSSFASNYYVVVPVPAKTTSDGAKNISVSLVSYSLPSGQVGQPYAGFDFKTLLSVTGDASYSGYGVHWSIAAGSLPAGLTLNSDGTLSGIPSSGGTASFQVMATYKTKAGQQAFQVFVANITVGLAAGTPPQAIVGTPYSYDLKSLLTVTGDSGYTPSTVTWSVVSSNLPAGLYLTADGFIGGTPTASGTGSITARASYKGVDGQQTYQVVSLSISVTLGAATLPVGNVGTAYSYDFKPLVSVSGDSSYNLSAVQWRAASLPAGLSITSAGVLSGTPTTTASNQNIAVVADYRGQDGQQQYTITVNPAFFDFNPTISTNTTNYSLYNAARSAGWDGVAPLRASVTVGAGVWVGGSSTGNYAFSTGSGFPAQSTLKLTNNGAIVGAGGAGGSGCENAFCSTAVGGNGGPALYAQYPLTVVNNNVIAGGGGGGGGAQASWQDSVVAGGSGGGGGEGYGTSAGGGVTTSQPSYPLGHNGGNGSVSGPGAGGAGTQSGKYPSQFSAPWYCFSNTAGSGGTWGQAGGLSGAASGSGCNGAGSYYPGGAAGYAVTGRANVTWTTTGTVYGPQN
jgi:hypothetical protein